ncbi:hypothetical protein [Pseudoduganella armeniaca]|uniref:Uncharacterized protein n=1 Tax=Pseudoduganella armeniaca TaxID=2072590 RepID=A0A2R4CCH0_9BURK|nr:hypothetical protein [Pseudoduganella armeniaca]AVR97316.1 hypothetical protein C9I28_17945 [Pseudoduganella armeniaca]
MADKRSFVEIDRDKLLSVLVDIEFILVSLHKMGSFYGERLPDEYIEYCKETTSFIDDNRVTQRLARMRTILSQDFDTIGSDGLSDIERALEEVKYWSPKKEP